MQFYSLKSQEVQKTIPELLFLKTISEFQGNPIASFQKCLLLNLQVNVQVRDKIDLSRLKIIKKWEATFMNCSKEGQNS